MTENTTIAALATPHGNGGLAVIRISGKDAFTVADKVFRSVSGEKLCNKKGYSAMLGNVFGNGEVIDEAVALVFREPKSYTGENTVEFSVHGGSFVAEKVLRAVFSAGAVPADRGEFTKRAFMNGKLDINEAEAVMDIISASGNSALRAGIEAKSGAVTVKSKEIKEKLTFAAATVAAFSDFPDEEPSFSGIDKLGDILEDAENELLKLIGNYDRGRMIKEGIRTAIIGAPNAGKSTLMNLLAGYDRSIVTDIAGTTRDTVEETVKIKDTVLLLSDTAGLRDTDDTVEKLGVERTKEKMLSSDLILAVCDSNDRQSDILTMLDGTDKTRVIVIFNKSDIAEPDVSAAERLGLRYVVMSAKNGSGTDRLEAEITSLTGAEHLCDDSSVFLNERQQNCAVRAEKAVKAAIDAYRSGVTADAVGVMIDEALAVMLELTGERVTVEVANEVFKRFCVGK